MKKQLVIIKVGRELQWALTDDKWHYPYKLTKREEKMLEETGWPRKLPDIYPGPKWPEER